MARIRRPKLLFIHSGSLKKRMTFTAAANLGADIYLFNPELNWAAAHAREVHCTAGLSLPEVIALAEALHQRVQLDGVITFWEEDVPTCSLICARLGLPGNTPDAALAARSKYRMRRALRRAGVPVPAFRRFFNRETLLDACATVGTPAVLKPEWGSDSEWVLRVESTQEALATYESIHQEVRIQDSIYNYRTGSYVLEGLLQGPEVSVEGVVQNGQVTLYAIIDKAKMDEDSFVERGETTPSLLPAAIQGEIRAMVSRGVSALGLNNSGIHAEVKVTPDGPRIVEIGARMGGDCIHALVQRVYGIDLATENIRAALGQPVSPSTSAMGYGLSRTLVPETPGLVRLIQPPKPRASRNLIEVVLTMTQGDRVAVPPHGYDNLAWISVWGRDYREASRRLDSQAARLESAFAIDPDISSIQTEAAV